ncbi:MAG: SDR family oxidoreductase, partial [Blastocatellia bacterium]
MKKVLVAGASGQLGRHVIQQLQQRGVMVSALARDSSKLSELGINEVVNGDLTMAETLRGCCDGVDAVISCAGASMSINNFRDRASFYEIDYGGNLNLLDEAKRAGIGKFVYVSLAGGDRLRQTEYGDAHEKFVAALQASEIRHTVVRPTGFFGFNLELLKFAAKGRGLVIGNGDCKTNPIHEADVAIACVQALESDMDEISIGGPQVFTRKEIVEMAFAALDCAPKLISISPGLFKLMISPLRFINRRV